jgi:cation diffusion facilitator CzcD-associated flavoprotein CzcO
VLATGFDTHRFVRPMNVIGRDARSLDDAWSHANEGYLGIAIPGFPNWFMLGGPNSPIGNFSWLMTSENQLNYAMRLIDYLRSGNVTEIAPKPSAVRAFNDAVKAKMPDTIWATGCNSWYIDKNGNVASWPWTYEKFESDMREPILDDFEIA